MKYVFIILGILCLIILAFVMLYDNGRKALINLFCKRKRLISWDPLEPRYDVTERFWHE